MTKSRLVFIAAIIYTLETQAIKLNNGGYDDIFIVIQDTVEENPELLERIKEVFTKSSQLLFAATKHKTYFKRIRVIIPKSWSVNPAYKPVPALAVLKAYIKVDRGIIKTPHVKCSGNTCGAEGQYMYLTPDFLLDTGVTEWGRHENVIVHEWGHLRWGLFDEYMHRNTKSTAFYMQDGEWKPNMCSANLNGHIGRGEACQMTLANIYCNTRDTKKKLHSTCNFCPSQNQTSHVSVMGFQYIDALTMFCDRNDISVHKDSRHNNKAPNAQNVFCDRKSAWEVMRGHPDFNSDKTMLPSNFNTTPEFEFVKETDGHRVFVLDTSSSMDDNDRIGILYRSGVYIIEEVIPFGSWLAVVVFDTTASRKGVMTQVNTEVDKDYLKGQLPISTDGATCIGCGIEEAIQILNDALGSAENGEIILITDGENNRGDLNASRAAALDAKVVIHTVAVSQQADTLLADIATETGGKHFTYLETETVSFASVFAATISDGGITSAASRSVMVMSETSPSSSNVFNLEFTLDEGLGRNTSITVLTNTVEEIEIHLKGPNNYTQNIKQNGNSATIRIKDKAQAGSYIVQVTLQQNQKIEYYIKSFPSSDNTSVIRMSSRLASSNVDVSTGALPVVLVDVAMDHAPILNATVYALVDSGMAGSGKKCTIDLYDNGADPDLFLNDGTYSGYILRNCLNSGRVSVKAYASGNEGETLLLHGISGAFSPGTPQTEVNTVVFQRVDVTEELFITNYVENTEDVTAPGRITDVSINNIETKVTSFGESRNFTITWTATGDDKNIGQALTYEMKIASDYNILMDAFETTESVNMTHVTIVPQAAGSIEALKLTVYANELFNEDAYFAVRAVDDNNNTGPVSNIVSIVVAKGYRIYGEQGNATDEDAVYNNDIEPSSAMNDDGGSMKMIIIGSSIAGAILLIIGGLLIALYCKRSARRNKPGQNNAMPAVTSEDFIAVNLDMEMSDTGVKYKGVEGKINMAYSRN